MRYACLPGILAVALVVAGCNFQNSSKLLIPTAPENTGAAGTTGGSTSSGGNSGTSGSSGSSGSAASAFSGAWGSSTIAGLPLGNCSDVKWLITAQTDTSVSGTVTADCASGVTVSANLTGTMKSANVIDLVATGTMTAMGVPCQFNLTGTGTRQGDDSMKVDYNGSYCLGTVSGSEVLRKFPEV
ncbi:MAG: hypothetical protein EHM55_05855 [Acidobacteria bacterium]|nr:MAG: hypothetical protein EHM55_05855 [Acidobacteriota bacterium]